MYTSLPDNILHPHINSLSNDAERVRSWILSQRATILLRKVEIIQHYLNVTLTAVRALKLHF